MAKYDIEFVEHRNMAGGFWVSVFSVITLEDDGSGQMVPDQFWITVDNEYLQIWHTPINPFDYNLAIPDGAEPTDIFELRFCDWSYVVEMQPNLNYMDYTDPIIFLDDDLEELDSRNNLFLACWYRWKFEVNKHGYC